MTLQFKTRLAPILVVTAFLIPWMAFPALAAAEENASTSPLYHPDYCSRTSSAAWAGCIHESLDDYNIRRGVCINTRDSDDRNECYAEARVEHGEVSSECWAQYAGREAVCDLLGRDRYDPEYEPEDFVDPETIGYGDGDTAPNPYFPLVPGNLWVYESEDEIITVEVLEDTIEIDGVICAVVRDLVVEKGGDADPIEDTLDWFAQDGDGNVWYFGEIAINYEDGQVTDIDGSWKTGEEGARPGILMPADPVVGDVYRQEWLLGDAEDMAEVIDTAAYPDLGEDNVADCDDGCLQTLEWTPLEEDSFEYKYYQAGIGMVQEANPEDEEETVELVEFTPASD